ncbi:MAG: LysM peptidoglycan-binding domain-containing protein, partial [Flavobacteriales bacterium]
LITNAPDTRSSGKTPPSQVAVNATLRKVSVQCQTAYFDLNKAMGGWGSLYTWNKKGFVLKDLLHFNKEGARVLGLLMAEAMFSATGLGEKDALASIRTELSANLCKTPGEPILTEASIPEVIKPKPAAPKKTSAAMSKKGRVYVVKKGDTLSGIAKKTGTTVKQLTTKNKISVNELLHPGQKLKY